MKIGFKIYTRFKTYSATTFNTYDDAQAIANTDYIDEDRARVCCVVDEKYIFLCARSAVQNIPYMIYNIQSCNGGQIETRIWWTEFITNPSIYLHLAHDIIN